MKFIDEFRSEKSARRLSEAIRNRAGITEMTFMEVCGTHTMAIARNGIRELLPENVTLISGPGCPVCVTPNQTIDRAIALSRLPDTVIATFGDMMKVPGSHSSLDREHARGGNIRVVTSTLEALAIAEKEPKKKVVFLGVGFETTTPTVAVALKEARRKKIANFFILSAHKVMPPAMKALSDLGVKIHGYLCPGHVSAIIGSQPYDFLPAEYGIGCVVAGFEPLDIMQALLMLVEQVRSGTPSVQVQYSRAVKAEGNPTARRIMDEVFEPCASEWRGLGWIPRSGLKIRDVYSDWDTERQIPVEVEPSQEPKGCLCGGVLRGEVKPPECSHFGKKCTPDNPVGPCMVSSEGTCAAYFKYYQM